MCCAFLTSSVAGTNNKTVTNGCFGLQLFGLIYIIRLTIFFYFSFPFLKRNLQLSLDFSSFMTEALCIQFILLSAQQRGMAVWSSERLLLLSFCIL